MQSVSEVDGSEKQIPTANGKAMKKLFLRQQSQAESQASMDMSTDMMEKGTAYYTYCSDPANKKKAKRMQSCENFMFGSKESSQSIAKSIIQGNQLDCLPEVKELNTSF